MNGFDIDRRGAACAASGVKGSKKTTGTPARAFGALTGVVLAIGGLMVSGCSFFNPESAGERQPDEQSSLLGSMGTEAEAEKPATQPKTEKKVRWDGGGVVLGEIGSSAFTPQSFVSRVGELGDEERFGTIRHLVRMYPDIAVKALQQTSPAPSQLDSLTMIARNFDELWCNQLQENNEGWQAYVAELANQRDGNLLTKKAKFWMHLRKHHPEKALALDLVEALPENSSAMLRAEAYRLEAIAHMMSDQFEPATDRLSQAIKIVQGASPYQANQMQLLLGEFYRHQGRLEPWKSTWKSAVESQSQLVRDGQLIEPVFWGRASFLRPAGSDWPELCVDNFRGYLQETGLANSGNAIEQLGDESTFWLMVGMQHLRRNEGQNAILALKKAEAAAGDAPSVDPLRLQQARGLIAAGQPGAASAVLYRIVAGNEGTVLADRAKAILGALKLQNGAVGQGIKLIESSIETCDRWPRLERMRAQADYSLSLLVKGSERKGLRLLDQVQQEFKSLGHFDQAQQCLWNKAKYFERTEQPEKAESTRMALADIEKRF